ncbi:hypothetical protein AVEN_159968-1, partial [Araneus ventricosus]
NGTFVVRSRAFGDLDGHCGHPKSGTFLLFQTVSLGQRDRLPQNGVLGRSKQLGDNGTGCSRTGTFLSSQSLCVWDNGLYYPNGTFPVVPKPVLGENVQDTPKRDTCYSEAKNVSTGRYPVTVILCLFKAVGTTGGYPKRDICRSSQLGRTGQDTLNQYFVFQSQFV